jgi:hypothetical protein
VDQVACLISEDVTGWPSGKGVWKIPWYYKAKNPRDANTVPNKHTFLYVNQVMEYLGNKTVRVNKCSVVVERKAN